MPICKKCSADFPNRVKVSGKIRVVNHRSYCFKCQPFGSKIRLPYILISERSSNKYEKTKTCKGCKIKKDKSEFYAFKDGIRFHPYCKKCHISVKKNQQREIKLKCVEYKGGKCQKCEYDKCVAAIDFHHRDPAQKSFNISTVRFHEWEVIRQELDKCDILCKNCHAEEHSRIDKEND